MARVSKDDMITLLVLTSMRKKYFLRSSIVGRMKDAMAEVLPVLKNKFLV